MMLWKNRNKKVGLCVTVVAGCLMLTIVWAILAMPETALAKKPDKPGGGKSDDPTRYGVTMNGDLTIVGGFNLDPGQNPPEDWGGSFETGIRVNGPRPKICFANAFLETGGVTFDGETCGDCGAGVIPDGNGRPNWGTLTVEGDATGVIVKYSIGETDAMTGKTRRYTLTTNGSVPVVMTQGSGTWPNGDGDDQTIYTITIPGPTEVEPGMSWSLVQAKPGDLNETLISTQDTVITFTEYSGS
jgi:hypothetical protein